MKKSAFVEWPVLLMLLMLIGFTPGASADVDLTDPFASVTITPKPGEIDNVTKFNQVKLTAPDGLVFSQVSISLNPVWLRKDNGDGTYTNLAKYRNAVRSDDKTEVTMDLASDASGLELLPGKYQIFIQKKSSFMLYDGGANMPNAVGNTAGFVFEYEYAPDESADVVWNITPGEYDTLLEEAFSGITIAFPEAQSVTVNEEKGNTDNITLKLNGEPVSGMLNISRDFLTFDWRGEKEGIVEFALAKGFYDVTMADGKVISSPEIATTFYIGDLGIYTSPADQSTTHPFKEYWIYFPKADKVTPHNVMMQEAYFKYGNTKMTYNNESESKCLLYAVEDNRCMELYSGNNFTIEGTVDGEIYYPQGAYTMEMNGIKFPSPMVKSKFTIVPSDIVIPDITTTPAAKSQQETLSEITVAFAGDPQVQLGEAASKPGAFTLTYGDTVLEYGTGFTTPDSPVKLALKETLAPLSPQKVTLHIAAGVYSLTLSDGTTVLNMPTDVTFTVGKAVPYTTTPAAKSEVEKLETFAVNFEGVTEVAWASMSNLPDITLTCGDVSMNYTNGFTEGDEITQMVLDEALLPLTPTTCTVKFGAGVYSLTLADGSVAESPEITFSFTLGRKITVTTTPTNKETVNMLNEFAVAFSDVKEVAWADDFKPENITLKYDDKQLVYGADFTEGDEITTFKLNEPLSHSSRLEVNAEIAAGTYTLTCNDGLVVPSPAVKFKFYIQTVFEIDIDSWIPVNNVQQFDTEEGLECILVWYFNGVKTIILAPDMDKAAPMVNNGVESCSAISTEEIFSGNKTYRGSTDITTYSTTGSKEKRDLRIQAIKNVPSDAAIVRIKKEAQGYTIYNINGENQGYFAPGYDKTVARAYLNTSADPYYNDITIGENNKAVIVSKYRNHTEGYNILSAMSDYTKKTTIYQYVQQELNLGNFIIFTKATPESFVTLKTDPADGSTVDATENNTYEITVTVGSLEQATYSGKPLTGSFNDTPLAQDAISVDGNYPPKVTVTLPNDLSGTLHIDFPEGWFTANVGGQDIPTPATPYTLNINGKSVIPVADITVEVTPSNGEVVSEISYITLTFPESVAQIDLNEEIAEHGGIETRINGALTSTPMMQNNTTFRYRPEFIDEGEFSFLLKEGFFMLTMADDSKALSPVIQSVFTVKRGNSLTDIDAESAPSDVYNTNGVLILRNATDEDIKSLAPGIYIKGGAVILKK